MRNPPNPRICGRRVCSGPCGRWRHLIDFPWRWPEGKNTYVVEGTCNYCRRQQYLERYHHNPEYRKRKLEGSRAYRVHNKDKIREYRKRWEVRMRQSELRRKHYVSQQKPKKILPGPPPPPRNLYYEDREAFNKMRRERHRWLMANNPAYRENRLEYGRIYQEVQRRKRGAKVIDISKRPMLKAERIPAEPFRQWLQEMFTKSESKRAVETILEVDESRLRKIVDGIDMKSDDTLDLDFVDRCLTKEGGTMLYELYPSLYKKAA